MERSDKPFEQLSMVEKQHKIDSWLQGTFNYWLGKNEENGFLRIDDFKRKMVMFGLCPSFEFMTSALNNFKGTLKIPTLTFDRKGSPRSFDESFIYNKSEITHISIKPVKQIFTLNKTCENVARFLKHKLLERWKDHRRKTIKSNKTNTAN